MIIEKVFLIYLKFFKLHLPALWLVQVGDEKHLKKIWMV